MTVDLVPAFLIFGVVFWGAAIIEGVEGRRRKAYVLLWTGAALVAVGLAVRW